MALIACSPCRIFCRISQPSPTATSTDAAIKAIPPTDLCPGICPGASSSLGLGSACSLRKVAALKLSRICSAEAFARSVSSWSGAGSDFVDRVASILAGSAVARTGIGVNFSSTRSLADLGCASTLVSSGRRAGSGTTILREISARRSSSSGRMAARMSSQQIQASNVAIVKAISFFRNASINPITRCLGGERDRNHRSRPQSSAHLAFTRESVS